MLLFILITFTLTRATSQKTSSDIILREWEWRHRTRLVTGLQMIYNIQKLNPLV